MHCHEFQQISLKEEISKDMRLLTDSRYTIIWKQLCCARNMLVSFLSSLKRGISEDCFYWEQQGILVFSEKEQLSVKTTRSIGYYYYAHLYMRKQTQRDEVSRSNNWERNTGPKFSFLKYCIAISWLAIGITSKYLLKWFED